MKRDRFAGQCSFLDELIVDSFAGGGGASTGIELATGRVVDIAINHDPDAIRMHMANHPYTAHYQASVWEVDPVRVCGGRRVGLLWASPDCKHFSKASGGVPKSRRIRGLAWVVLRWAGTVRPRVIILENVEEFRTWGPVRRGKPVRAKAGQTFRKFLFQLRALGYETDWRELVAADYGAPTTRKRFFLIARCDGRPIVWPETTHGPADSPEVRAGAKKPWRAAAEVIDWTLPCPSIFDTRGEIAERYGLKVQRPLRPNTMRRVARGIDRFVIRSAAPFIVGVGGRCGDCPPRGTAEPHRTVTAKADAALCTPYFVQYHAEQSERETRGQVVTEPLRTADASNRYGLAAATLCKYYGGTYRGDGQSVMSPLHTVTTKDREGVCVASLAKFYGGVTGISPEAPLPTVTAIDHNALQVAHMEEMYGNAQGRSVAVPLSAVTSHDHQGIVVTRMEAAESTDFRYWPEIRELLNRYCGYQLAADEVLLFEIGGARYFMADIGLRMLTPRELYRAQGFPDDYIIDRDANGKPYPKAAQVARCGNAVPPPFATALVRANFPEWCDEEIVTMRDLMEAVAV